MTRQYLRAFAYTLTHDDHVVIEATGNAAAVSEVLAPHVGRVVIANPRQVRLIAARATGDLARRMLLASLYFLDADGFLAEGFRIVATARGEMDSAAFVAMVHPTAKSEHLDLVADWFVWLFLVDDQLDDGHLGRSPDRVRDVVERMVPVGTSVDVELVWDPPWTPDKMTGIAKEHFGWTF